MAYVTDRYTKRCRCCGLEARVKKWSCGCVTVSYDRGARACSDCDSFRDLERSCGKSGCPAGD